MQGVIKSYDPNTKDGVVMSERDFIEFSLLFMAAIKFYVLSNSA